MEFMYHFPILSVIVLFLGAFVTALVGRTNGKLRTAVVVISMVIPLVLMFSLIKPVLLDGQIITYWLGGWEPVEGWAFGISLEVDALSLFFALIVVVAIFVAGLYSFTYMNRDDSLVNFYTLFLMLSGSALGLVVSGDLFNIFIMVEIMTFTAVALTAFRTNYSGALEGAFKYLAVGSLGSASLLIGVALIYSQLHTLNLAQIAALLPGNMNPVTVASFAFLFLGFGVKASLFPFHTLSADAYPVAPASVSLMISGVLTKCGVYGIVRLSFSLFQNSQQPFTQYFITAIGCITMFICVTMAFNQHNFKRLLAFHSASQVGYVVAMIGLGTLLGLESGLYHALNHTLFKGLLFLTAGAVFYATGSLDMDKLGGLSRKMPRTTILFLIGAASISGLPPFNGFASKWMMYQAAFERGANDGNFFFILVCIFALLTSVLTLASFIKVTQSVFFGQLPDQFRQVKEVPLSMRIPMWVLAGLCIITGLFASPMQKWVLEPASRAAMNVAAYIDSAMGAGHSAQFGVTGIIPGATEFVGSWNPVIWLLLLLCVTFAVCFVSLLAAPNKDGTAIRSEAACEEDDDPKFDSFFSGEKASFSQVGGSDLFWGFKHNWRKYFTYMQNWHSGVVNDYTLYGVVALAVTLVLCVIFL